MDQVRTVTELICRQLNGFLQNADRRAEDWVILSNVTDHEGRIYDAARDKVVMSVANITHETTVSTYTSTIRASQTTYTSVAPPLYIDLYILFFANFYDRNYGEALTMISRTIAFFQQNPRFNHENLPDLDPQVDRLTMEITNLDLLEVNYLMGMLGAKYLPSVYYKLRMIPFASDAIQSTVPGVQGIDTPQTPEDLV